MRNLLHNAWFWFVWFCLLIGVATYISLGYLVAWASAELVTVDTNYAVPVVKVEPDTTKKIVTPAPSTLSQSNNGRAIQITENPQTVVKAAEAPVPNVVAVDCQYPDRFYADGSCDNSDPACPETIKDPVLKGNCL